MNVMTTTSIMKERIGLLLRSKSRELIKAARTIMAILIMLLVTRMLLSSFSGFERRFRAVAALLLLLCSSSSMSPGVSEKKATSEPEINADATISSISIMIWVTSATMVPVTATSGSTPPREPDNSVSKIRILSC